MEYFEILGLNKEPFMDTADPYFFHATSDREEILTRLEVSVRVGRGLSIILGAVGSGKTTLAQTLERNLLQDDNFILGKIIDPSFSSEYLFLTQIAMIFEIEHSGGGVLALKNAIKNYLYKMGVEEGKTILLIVDEAQKLTEQNLETLRILLNYQAPDRKLLNLILFAQPELMESLQKKINFVDRISSLFFLSPLERKATDDLIEFRLRQAGLTGNRELFTAEAKGSIYTFAKGNLRKLINVCHEVIEELVIQEKSQVTPELVQRVLFKRNKVEQLLLENVSNKKEEEHSALLPESLSPPIHAEVREEARMMIPERGRVAKFSGFFGRLLHSLNGL